MHRRLLVVGAAVAAFVTGLGLLAVGPAVAATHPKPSAKTATQASAVPAAWRMRTVPFASLPARTRAALRAAGVRSADVAVTQPDVLKYASTGNGMCLDANNAGPTAGKNGDKAQLWGCVPSNPPEHPNQWWIPVQTTDGWTELMSYQYANMCLDADSSGGFVDGAKVQLWHCYNDAQNRPNQWWNFGGLQGCITVTGYCRLVNMWIPAGQSAKTLDANDAGPTGGHNGDKVQIWSIPGDGDNQQWSQFLATG